jgi:metal-responsive CopG/Arc/MetJ family transcriptional regulator
MSNIARFTVSIEDDLLERFDQYCRDEAMRLAVKRSGS